MPKAIIVTTPQDISAQKYLWISSDLDLLPDNGNLYEIIDGELFVSRAPHSKHQKVGGRLFYIPDSWSRATGLGEAELGPGLIFSDHDDVIPDVMWFSKDRYTALIDEAGHFRGAPELVIEVLSTGAENERRDRQVKLKLYSTRGVLAYWIVDWRNKQMEIYLREQGMLKLAMILYAGDTITLPMLPGIACPLAEIFD